MVEHITARRVVVTGGRDYTNRDQVFRALDALATRNEPIARLYHGACGVKGRPGWKRDGWTRELRGADGLAHQWATDRRVVVQAWPAFWDLLGRRAGPVRNGWMLGAALSDACAAGAPLTLLAFQGGDGTADCVAQARRLSIEVIDLRPDTAFMINADDREGM